MAINIILILHLLMTVTGIQAVISRLIILPD